MTTLFRVNLRAALTSETGFNWACSPSVTELEIITLNWVAKMLGFSDDFVSTGFNSKGGGIILGSASEVALTVAIAAREKALSLIAEGHPSPISSPHSHSKELPEEDPAKLDPNADVAANGDTGGSHQAASAVANASVPSASALAAYRGKLTSRLVMYGTTQTHSIAAKAALILGIHFRALDVSQADGFALRGTTLKAALEEDHCAGRVPFMLIASLGTTSSGAIDNFAEIVEVAKQYPTLWIHVDAAYAGVALTLPEVRPSCFPEALNAVDSFSTNLHKWGLVQFDCSPLLVRDRTALSSALTVTPEFLKTRQADSGSVLDMRNLQIPLGRRFRSLKIWFVLRSYGLEGFRSHLRAS